MMDFYAYDLLRGSDLSIRKLIEVLKNIEPRSFITK
jgi:hypothetical protein